MNKFSLHTLLLLTLGLLMNFQLKSQDFPHSPIEILKVWDYYRLLDELGDDGEAIIGRMSGQDYIAGMRYSGTWFGRSADISFYFSDIDISTFSLRFWSSNMSSRTHGINTKSITAQDRDSIFVEVRRRDSLRNDSVTRLLRSNPEFLAELKETSARINAEKKRLYDMDSMRCDSLITDIAKVMGQPYEKGRTLHTEAPARYFARWINQGMAISLKDYTDYTDVSFSIPLVVPEKARVLNLDPKSEIYQTMKVSINQDTVVISLLCLPAENTNSTFTEAGIIVEPGRGAGFSEKLGEDLLFTHPDIRIITLDQDKKPVLWFTANLEGSDSCTIHQFYQFEGYEPILLWNSAVDLHQVSEGHLYTGFQADMTLSDGTRMTFPLEANKLPGGLYNASGVLASRDILIPGCLRSVRVLDKGANTLVESTFDVVTHPGQQYIARAVVNWQLARGFWVVKDFRIIQP